MLGIYPAENSSIQSPESNTLKPKLLVFLQRSIIGGPPPQGAGLPPNLM